jgi:hypothetical protein
MKPRARSTELKVGTTRRFTQPADDVETDAEHDKPSEESVPVDDTASLTVPTTGEPKDL